MNKPIIYLLSDSLGETAEQVIKAALLQFGNGQSYKIYRTPYIQNKAQIKKILTQATQDRAIIGYTLVDPDLRQYVMEKSYEYKLEVIDIIGPMLDAMERLFEKKPKMKPGLNHQLDESYFKRVEAIEFAVKYDDGRDPRGIEQADIVLIGVSRTSKTPLSQYLAHKSLKVANVPIVPEVEPPRELFNTDPNKCYGLKISSGKLNGIRKERLKALGLKASANYAAMDRIDQELEYFDAIVDRLGCPVIDVTNKAVEETANIILQIQMTR
ncbi:kinase/pyrophosphorylase [Amphibacillus sp. MSJ-3]|uniref:pyruvate, water dikinase regulatory protein n=1 Tax=Amphibacillus sp. MSJ-3 TaxID=2841505 RepID=UPI001C0EC3BE|nr:pyruvate, water dikinase regulatory protein [Amphibacillus sp. MSJ-3]MBU5595159.1 kinase/pyrophosphorylase [Amphibacillus sp. MSJ-3]